ncbi:DNA polymerase III subunit beta [Streptomyces sp. APSN-46.1]|uniref:DNA polymerase III subunit beta n=1 Tax=Streptomyces sp. APSN-46.1 TaxID=2929049 RepID=UPI001FB2D3D9|nr:DNA polymerase III subunit beta [Streptomyces sp. APSN-46.1]MCJ1681160.1 DNA polymerase III subunit beta [Streptomyces sp. APSN-46.1]
MKFRVERDEIVEATAWAARSLASRPVVPILAGILLKVDERLTLSGYDYENSTRADVDVEVIETGAVLVSGRLLAEIMRSMPPGLIEFVGDANKVTVEGSGTRFTLQTLPVEDYPALPVMPGLAGTVDGDAFSAAVAQVSLAAARDEAVPVLTGLHLEAKGDRLTLACTDRYRIAMRELKWNPADPDVSLSAVVPAKAIAQAAKSVPSGTTVSLTLGGTANVAVETIGFEFQGRKASSRLISAEFINYRQRLPREFATRAAVRTAPFVDALKRVSLVANRNSPVRLTFRGAEVILEAATGDEAQAVATMAAQVEGEDISIAFNPQFLLDALSAVETEVAVLNCQAPLKSAVLTARTAEGEDLSDYQCVIMPVRVS